MNLREALYKIGLLKRLPQDISAESARFKSDQAFQQYMDEAQYNIITGLISLDVDDVEGFKKLKYSQMALSGFNDFIDQAIISEKMRERSQRP